MVTYSGLLLKQHKYLEKIPGIWNSPHKALDLLSIFQQWKLGL